MRLPPPRSPATSSAKTARAPKFATAFAAARATAFAAARAAAFAGACASACAPIDRARECEALAQTLNPALALIEAQTASLESHDPDAHTGSPKHRADEARRLDEIAAAYQALSEQIEALKPKDDKLIPIKRDLTTLFAKTAKTARDIANNVADDDLKGLGSASRRLERDTHEQHALVGRARRICKTK